MFIQTLKHLPMAAVTISHVLSSTTMLAPTPPMGFNNWASSMCRLNESLFVKTAQSMVENGLLAAGYNHINLDDCWSTMERAPNGSMVWDLEKFPRGLPWLTNHLKGLGFVPGIYTDAGTLSCGGYPGAYGHEETDARDFANWGFEYLKMDGCNMPTGTEQEYKSVYGHWHDVLSKLKIPMVFSESTPAYFAEAENLTDWYLVMGWVPKFGQLARHSRDTLVFNSTLYWPDITGWDSIMFNYGQEVRLARYQRPGYFNDPDFLNVDHFDLSLDEKRSHFAIWASFSAPLIISAYIPGLSAQEIEYLRNKDIIAVDQDPLALQATLVSQDGTWDVLTKNLANGDRLLTIINRGDEIASHAVSFERIGMPSTAMVNVQDLWTGISHFAWKQVTAVDVPPHGTAVLRLRIHGKSTNIIPTGMIFNTFSLEVLTAGPQGVTWSNSTGSDSQIWQTRKDGTIRSLSALEGCLTDFDGDSEKGLVGLSRCEGSKGQKWDYHISGNSVNRRTKLCLTQQKGGEVTTQSCLYEDNSQVVGLPSGIKIVQD